MRAVIAFAALIACIALVHGGCMPRKYPVTRGNCYTNKYYEYPLMPQNYENYFMHNYVKPTPNDGYPYFGYPYGECSSCRKYQTEEVAVVKPDCPCQQHH
uniref:Uncharacterized protein n=1 Tax=Anopheles epiroticus TaxID=199890 RepID=A0A182PRX4_9DIPT